MIGNLITKGILKELVENNLIEFRPFFDIEAAQIAQYPLKAKSFLKKTGEKTFTTLNDFKISEQYIIKPNQFIIVEIMEQIILPEGIVGRFIPASNLIEFGLGLIAGKLEHPFGKKGEMIRFGLKNYTDEEVAFNKNDRVAYIEFFDLRGLKHFETKLTERDEDIYSIRRQRIYPITNDGEVNYDK
ncbi:MAG TPA: hypothetical protein VK668_02500 [Mucilaginibacter sp.]|nr:hypothetical protein [Mucilaginibacter sp.]